MRTKIGHQLRACGRRKLPESLILQGEEYSLVLVFKHDFFAATALYQKKGTGNGSFGRGDKIVLKLGRYVDFLGLPMTWLGEMLAKHESEILTHIQQEQAVPQLLGRYGKTGLIYRYIEGQSLAGKPALPEDFFGELEKLVTRIHGYRVVYVDMNKRGNILLGSDGRPRLIDFQISFHIPARVLGSARLADRILEILKKEDIYHLHKHRYRFCRDKQERKRLRQARRVSPWILWHRRLTRPLTGFRRYLLGYLFRTGQLVDDISERNPETDPARWDR
jgi:hypothetical protein